MGTLTVRSGAEKTLTAVAAESNRVTSVVTRKATSRRRVADRVASGEWHEIPLRLLLPNVARTIGDQLIN
jgi:hypothetical protein